MRKSMAREMDEAAAEMLLLSSPSAERGFLLSCSDMITVDDKLLLWGRKASVGELVRLTMSRIVRVNTNAIARLDCDRGWRLVNVT